MKSVFINFASPQPVYVRAQTRACAAVRALNLFDLILPYQATDLGQEFHEKNQDILRHERGYGYWLWKPYLILKTLQREDLKEGDLVFYSDTDHLWKAAFKGLMDLFVQTGRPILGFARYETRGDPPYEVLTRCVKQDLLTRVQKDIQVRAALIHAGYIFFRKCSHALSFCRFWYECMQQEHIISETPSYLHEETEAFVWHLHDQAVFSVLCRVQQHAYVAFCEEGDVEAGRGRDPLFLTPVRPLRHYAHKKTPESTLSFFQKHAIYFQWRARRWLETGLRHLSAKDRYMS